MACRFRVRKADEPKVRILQRCDGSDSNAGIVIGGPDAGNLIRRMDGHEMNCCPVDLRYIWTGEGASPAFPHNACVLDFEFLKTYTGDPDDIKG